MGRPTHYSTELATRCQRLIDRLIDQVEQDAILSQEFRGPLRTTFLLAMSTPMIVLPMERLYKPVINRAGVADDTPIDPMVKSRVQAVFDGRAFRDTPLFEDDQWAYIAETQSFPVADPWPSPVFDELDRPGSKEAASAAPMVDIVGCLRNALAHGGVAYLDDRGRQSDDATAMFGFASRPDGKRSALRLLRVSTDAYQRFLARWSGWLADAGVETVLTHDGPGWFQSEEVQ